ncbi:MAG: bacillithiol system redox-active protein YtxJ [Bacteroidia bacterium]
MLWLELISETQLEELAQKSSERPQLLFKHSTRCGISLHAKFVLDGAFASLLEVADLHYLDLLNYRSLSHEIAHTFSVPHQSPQVIVLKNGEVVYAASHQAISPEKIIALLAG